MAVIPLIGFTDPNDLFSTENTWTAKQTFDGGIVVKPGMEVGEGDHVNTQGNPETLYFARVARFAIGTAEVPDTIPGPAVKIDRTLELPAVIGGDRGDRCAVGLWASVTGVGQTGTMPTALHGSATNATTEPGESNPDACGAVLRGYIQDPGQGYACGATITANLFTDEGSIAAGTIVGRATGIELHTRNNTTFNDSWVADGETKLSALRISPRGLNRSGVAINMQRDGNDNQQWDVGIGFPGGADPKSNPCLTASIADYSNSLRALDVRGSHATGAITVAAGAGGVVVGGTTRTNDSGGNPAELEVIPATDAAAIRAGSASWSDRTLLRLINSFGQARLQVAKASSSEFTGAADGDVLLSAASGKRVMMGVSGGAASLIVGGGVGFHGTAPQPQNTGWQVQNPNNLKILDVNAAVLGDVRRVLGTLISVLLTRGDLAA